MSLKDDIPELIKHIETYAPLLSHNEKLFDIYEGNLLPYVERALADQLSQQSFEQARHRISPLNVLVRIVDKLSKIFQQNPIREAVTQAGLRASPKDVELLKWYEATLKVNSRFNISNEFFNLFKNNLIQPFVHDGKPKLRIIPSDRFLPYSNDPVDPTYPTHMILFMGSKTVDMDKGEQKTLSIYHVYTADEFLIFNSDGDVEAGRMMAIGNPEGVNPHGVIPFTYVNRSSNLLIPKPDSDTFNMAILIPVLLSDLNYAVCFQTFSIVYTLNGKLPDNFKMAPNTVWPIEGKDDESTPSIGQIKPQVDIDQVLNLIQSELAFWLNTKGIRPGSLGKIGGADTDFASGISKLIDEMDTTEARNRQVETYVDVEKDFWDLLLNHMHPVWARAGLIENKAIWTPTSKVITNFSEQIPLLNRGDLIRDLKEEVSAGFSTRKSAIKRLNPKKSDEEIDMLLKEIDLERGYVDTEENLNDGETAEI